MPSGNQISCLCNLINTSTCFFPSTFFTPSDCSHWNLLYGPICMVLPFLLHNLIQGSISWSHYNSMQYYLSNMSKIASFLKKIPCINCSSMQCNFYLWTFSIQQPDHGFPSSWVPSPTVGHSCRWSGGRHPPVNHLTSLWSQVIHFSLARKDEPSWFKCCLKSPQISWFMPTSRFAFGGRFSAQWSPY